MLFFAYLWQIFAFSNQDKHLNRLNHTLADQFLSCMTLRDSLGLSQHNINVPKLAFWNLGGQIGYFLLIFNQFWSWKPTKTSKQIKTNTGTSVSIIYDIKKSLEMSQHKIKATELNFQDLEGQNLLFLLIFDQFLVMEANINI